MHHNFGKNLLFQAVILQHLDIFKTFVYGNLRVKILRYQNMLLL